MFSISTLFLFMGAAVLLILIPGPDLIFAITQGITNGRKAGVYTAIGLALGNTVHTLAAALGLTALIFGLLAYFAGVFSGRLLEKPRVQEIANIGASVIFLGLGIKLLST